MQRTSAAAQTIMIGSVSTCGRASICGANNVTAAMTMSSAGIGESSRSRKRVNRATASAIAAAASATTPAQPESAYAAASMTSDNHSKEIQGAPCMEKENGSLAGTARCAMIQRPIAI